MKKMNMKKRSLGATMLEYVIMALAVGVLVTTAAMFFGGKVSEGLGSGATHVSKLAETVKPLQ